MSITLDDFIKKYSGKQVDANGNVAGDSAAFQCVDVVNLYLSEVLDQPMILNANAVDFLTKAPSTFTIIENTPTGFPNPGDIVVFHEDEPIFGVNGHVAVVLSADANLMTVFEQNYPTGSACTTGTHNYNGCTGWMHLTTPLTPAPTPTTPPDTSAADLQTILTHYNVKTAAEFITSNDQQLAYLAQARAQVTSLQEQYADYDSIKNQLTSVTDDTTAFCDKIQELLLSKDASFTTLTADITTLVGKTTTLQDSLTTAQKQLGDNTNTYNAQVAALTTRLSALEEANVLLTSQITQLKSDLATATTTSGTQTQNILQKIISQLETFLKGKV